MNLHRYSPLLFALLPLACAGAGESTNVTHLRPGGNAAINAAGPRSGSEAFAGSAGLDDEYYPMLGNGGYDVLHYDLTLDVDVEQNQIVASAVIDARTTQHLAAFNLDFDGLQIDRITVDGKDVGYERANGELTITPDSPIRSDTLFQVAIDYSGEPGPIEDPGVPFAKVGWTHTDSGIYVVSEPSGSSGWFPVNDHPTDKAIYSLAITVPKPYVAASNGVLIEQRDEGERETFVWMHAHPMSSYLVTLAISKFEVVEHEGPNGLPIHDFYYSDISDRARENFARQGEVIQFLTDLYGPYPFETAGAIVTDAPIPGALETQTRPIYGKGATGTSVIVHEIAHQWFGNCVTLGAWKDIWLNEGFASYSQWLWSEVERDDPEKTKSRVEMRYKMLVVREVAPAGDPKVTGIFSQSPYIRGAFTLLALRLEVGDEAFFEIMRTYLARHRFGTAVSSDFIAVCEEVSGEDLTEFFDGWLYSQEIPAVPQLNLDPETTRVAWEKDQEERDARNAERLKRREERKLKREEKKREKEKAEGADGE